MNSTRSLIRQTIMVAFLAAGCGVTAGCSSDSEFVRVRNPFQSEVRIAKSLLGAGEEEPLPVGNPYEAPPVGSEASASRTRTVPADSNPDATEKPKKEKSGGWLFGKTKKPDSPDPNPDPLVEKSRVSESETARVESVVVRSRRTSGTICYPCNGKGFTWALGSANAGKKLCPQCAGAGRL